VCRVDGSCARTIMRYARDEAIQAKEKARARSGERVNVSFDSVTLSPECMDWERNTIDRDSSSSNFA
jgi:hypothetical protein